MNSGKFQIDEVIGVGSYGNVYSGTYRGVTVAIKKLALHRLLADGNADREPEAMLRLNHPNVIKLFYWQDEGEFRYLVMELCGATLRDYLSGKYRGDVPSDMEALYQMAAGLQHIHSNNLVHRNIKPENILITPSSLLNAPRMKISGFVFCKGTTFLGKYTQSGIKGTPKYLAPELLRLAIDGKHNFKGWASNASDVFSLGCVFYELLTRGMHPFGYGLHVTNIVAGNYSLKDLPEQHFAHRLIQSMIHENPDKRPSASMIIEQLRPFRERRAARFKIVVSVFIVTILAMLWAWLVI